MAQFTEGEHVRADFGEGLVIAHVDSGPHEVAGADGPETKWGVQDLTGKVHNLAYREPPYDENGSGGTFRRL